MYEFFQIVDGQHDDPTLFPVLSAPEQPLPFEIEPADGNRHDMLESKSVSVAQRTTRGWTQVRTFRDLRFGVVITDARVVVHCEKWTKGGGWRGFGVGGLAFAAAANVVSHARAAHRRKGKLLVAQVRYPWLAQAGVVSDRRGRPAAVRLVVNAGTRAEQRLLALDIAVGHGDPAALAAGIVTLAARFRLAGEPPVPEQEAAAWQRMARDATPHGANGVWPLPSAVPVGAAPVVPVRPAAPSPSSETEIRPAGQGIPLPSQGIAQAAQEITLPSNATPPPVAPAGQSSTTCPACGHVATVAAATCPRCGLAVAERGGSATAGTPAGLVTQMRDPAR
jgi:hypothetical protein